MASMSSEVTSNSSRLRSMLSFGWKRTGRRGGRSVSTPLPFLGSSGESESLLERVTVPPCLRDLCPTETERNVWWSPKTDKTLKHVRANPMIGHTRAALLALRAVGLVPFRTASLNGLRGSRFRDRSVSETADVSSPPEFVSETALGRALAMAMATMATMPTLGGLQHVPTGGLQRNRILATRLRSRLHGQSARHHRTVSMTAGEASVSWETLQQRTASRVAGYELRPNAVRFSPGG
eukprot:9331825-Pyramimonas_sp.AAC.1